MSQLHIHANPGDIAPFVLLPGDPNRAKYIAETFLENPKLYNDNRQLLGYTGTYEGNPVSIQTTGMGCPSLAIVVEEMIRLGARTLLRIGTTGIISKAVKPGELVIAMAANPLEGTTKMYLKDLPYAPTASFNVTRRLVEAAESQSLVHHVGLINTEDAFYATKPEHVQQYEDIGVLSVEMEASALFLLGKLRKVETGCALVASNYIGDPQFVEASMMKHGIDNMAKTALEAGLKLR
ncbi:MAG: purine-nucleoside phosphorylase [Trueperaceae bacterium]